MKNCTAALGGPSDFHLLQGLSMRIQSTGVYAPQSGRSEAVRRRAADIGPEIPSTGGSDTTDELDLSAEGAAADVRIYRPELFPARADGSVHVEDIRAVYERSFASVKSRIQELFAENRIDTSAPVPLEVAGDGRVIVAGDHPQKEKIESFFRDDPGLRNDFVGMTAQGEFLRAADEATEFQRAYREDPEGALEKFKHLFRRRNDVFQLVFRGNEAETRFTDAPA
jgi:hypothetical protein